jgi:hypothetical protein
MTPAFMVKPALEKSLFTGSPIEKVSPLFPLEKACPAALVACCALAKREKNNNKTVSV